MPRSGGTLLYQLVKEIAESNNICKGRGFPKEKYKSGVVKTDTCQPWMIDRVKNDGALAFGTYRDFRDIIVSLQKFYTRRSSERFNKPKQWSVDDVLKHRPDILDIQRCWEPHATWFKYEDDSFQCQIVKQVSKQLGVTSDIWAIIDKYSRQANDQRIKQQKQWMDAGTGSMLTRIHISDTRGRSVWREVLSQEDLAKVETVGDDWLRKYGYE